MAGLEKLDFFNLVLSSKLTQGLFNSFIFFVFTRPAVNNHSLQFGPSAVLPLLPVPASVPPCAGRGGPALHSRPRPGDALLLIHSAASELQ